MRSFAPSPERDFLSPFCVRAPPCVFGVCNRGKLTHTQPSLPGSPSRSSKRRRWCISSFQTILTGIPDVEAIYDGRVRCDGDPLGLGSLSRLSSKVPRWRIGYRINGYIINGYPTSDCLINNYPISHCPINGYPLSGYPINGCIVNGYPISSHLIKGQVPKAANGLRKRSNFQKKQA